MSLPPLSSRRAILFFLGLMLLSGAAMLPALHTLSSDGASILKIETAGSASKAKEIHEMLSDDARQALYIQLFVDVPFIIGYSGLIAAICLWTANLVERSGQVTMAGLLTVAALLGPAAGACDISQNIALAFVNGGHTGQPWPRISQVGGYAIWIFATIALLLALGNLVAWAGAWRRRSPA